MEIVFIAITQAPLGMKYLGTADAVRAAEQKSGCRTWLISDRQLPCANFRPLSDYWKTAQALLNSTTTTARSQWAVASILRWLVLQDFVDKNGDLKWPILALDYDVIVFSDLTKCYSQFSEFDACAPIYGDGTSAAYSVHRRETLQDAVIAAFRMSQTVANFHDMALWSEIFRSGKWKFGNLLPETPQGVFDMNMHHGVGEYIMEPSSVPLWGPETKRITWKDGMPHFTRIADGKDVPVNWIHCWGSYKNRTRELLKQAGI